MEAPSVHTALTHSSEIFTLVAFFCCGAKICNATVVRSICLLQLSGLYYTCQMEAPISIFGIGPLFRHIIFFTGVCSLLGRDGWKNGCSFRWFSKQRTSKRQQKERLLLHDAWALLWVRLPLVQKATNFKFGGATKIILIMRTNVAIAKKKPWWPIKNHSLRRLRWW